MSKIGTFFIEYLNTHPEIDIEDTHNAEQIYRLAKDTGNRVRPKREHNSRNSDCTILPTHHLVT